MKPLQQMKDFFNSGRTKDYNFRKEQLNKLKKYILDHEDLFHQALYADLKKNPEESWVTEIGFLLAEINHTLKHLQSWMKRQRVSTNLLNFPSKSFIYAEPVGIVLIIGTWNYPLQLLLTPMVGAIAAGNCIVLKPSEFAPATASVIEEMIIEIFEEGYITCIQGDGAEVIPPLVRSFRFDHIFYTGSTAVGKSIYELAAAQLIPVTLELGGKSPCIIEQDADVEVAARRIAVTKFSNAGQMCVAPDYILVHNSVAEMFIKHLKKNIELFFSKDPSASNEYGKIINQKQYVRLKNYLQNKSIAYGGGYDEATHYIQPTIIVNPAIDDAVMTEEIFGPILPVLEFADYNEAKSIIDRHPDPLAFYLFTNDAKKEKQWLTDVRFGGGCVNNASWHLTNFNLPFGGIGNSGIGQYHGKFSFQVFSHLKAIMKTPTWFDPKIKYPPFKGKLSLFKKIVR